MDQPSMGTVEGGESHQDLAQEVVRLQGVVRQLQGMVEQLWRERSRPAAATPPTTPEPPIPLPEPFSGDRTQFRDFQSACEMHFQLRPRTYSDPRIRVLAAISCLRGEPRRWANGLLEERSSTLDSPTNFFLAMKNLYDHPFQQSDAESTLCALKQGARPAEDYVVQFRMWAPATGWNDTALAHQFRTGLSDTIKDELARAELPDTLSELMRLAVRIDQRLRERQRAGRHPKTMNVPVVPRGAIRPRIRYGQELGEYPPEEEPMELGGVMVPTPQVIQNQRRAVGQCFYCGSRGHYIAQCPVRPPRRVPRRALETPQSRELRSAGRGAGECCYHTCQNPQRRLTHKVREPEMMPVGPISHEVTGSTGLLMSKPPVKTREAQIAGRKRRPKRVSPRRDPEKAQQPLIVASDGALIPEKEIGVYEATLRLDREDGDWGSESDSDTFSLPPGL